MPTYLLVLIVFALIGASWFASAAVTRKQFAKEREAKKDDAGIRNYVLEASTETAFVRARFDPPIPTSLPTDEQMRLGLKNMVNVDWNAAFAMLYGYPADYDMSRVSLGERLSISDPRNQAFIRNFIENDYRVIGHDMIGVQITGEPVAIVASTSGVIENGYLTGLWGTMINKTALINAESELRKSKEMLSRTLRLSPDAIVISKLEDGVIIDVNDGFRVLTGYSRGEVIEMSTVELGLWNNPARRDELLKIMLETGSFRDQHVEFIAKSGEIVECLISAECMKIGSEDCVLSLIRRVTPENNQSP